MRLLNIGHRRNMMGLLFRLRRCKLALVAASAAVTAAVAGCAPETPTESSEKASPAAQTQPPGGEPHAAQPASPATAHDAAAEDAAEAAEDAAEAAEDAAEDAAESTGTGKVQLASEKDVRDLMQALERTPVLVNIWATWCEPCVKEMPELEEFYQEHGAEIGFVSLSADFVGDGTGAVAAFVEEFGLTFPVHVLDGVPPEEVNEVLGTGDTGWDGALPATFLLNAEHEVIQNWFEAVTLDELVRELEKL